MTIPGFYVWEVAGRWISIELSLGLVDRLQQDVIRGFGSVPRRGAEVGGILLGMVTAAGRIVRIEDYLEIPIEYRRGPSYLLSEPDAKAFEAELAQLRSNPSNPTRPIGYFRSHTRDGVGLAPEDLDLVAKYFPGPETVILLIRPFGTKPSMAGFYFKEDGQFQTGPPLLEFPFRRRDLAPEDATAPAERPSPSVSVPSRIRRAAEAARQSEHSPGQDIETRPAPSAHHAEVIEPVFAREVLPIAPEIPEAKPKRSGRVWIPVSILCLLAGILAGFQAAIRVGPQALGGLNPYNLSLTVTPSGNDLEVRWDRQSPVIGKALKGILTVEDGSYKKSIDLDTDRLQGGSELLYRHYSNDVRFRLEVFLRDSTSVAEAVEWKSAKN